MTTKAENIRSLFRGRYLTGMLLIAALAFTSLFVLLGHESWQSGQSRQVNLAATQKATSQRIAFLANAMMTTLSDSDRAVIREQLRTSAQQMLQDHEALVKPYLVRGHREKLSPIGMIMFNDQEPFDAQVRRFAQQAIDLSMSKDESEAASGDALREINLLGMTSIPQTHDVIAHILVHESESAVRQAKFTQGVLIVLIVALLILEALFIFEPMGRKIRDSVREADKARQRAEEEAASALRAKRAKDQFFRTMSHEMRTPLNAVTGMTDLLRDTSLDQEQRDRLDHLHDASRHLRHLVNDVLALNRLDTDDVSFNLSFVSLNQQIKSCIEMLRHEAAHKRVDLNFSSDIPEDYIHETDSFRFRQVIINLIGSGMKSISSGFVDIAMTVETASAADDEVIRISIQSTGSGAVEISPKENADVRNQAQLIVDARGDASELGLALCRQIINKAGGEMSTTLTSRGQSVVVTVPMKKTVMKQNSDENSQPSIGEVEERGAPEKMKILVADDNMPNRMIARAFLQSDHVEIIEVENGAEAVDAMNRHDDIDLILMDIDMPVMDGVEATCRIREQSEAQAVMPIIAVTAHVLPEDASLLLEAGLTEVLHKPVTKHELSVCVSSHVKATRAA
ncbi:response regulator [Parvularcula sp. IMCC14364]|uniref:response regulator n=1 Tax=Parvularcula sp. IMCC14364 TaxID=3067902 RepID=UPI0027404FBA|nr:response regulator [Parvularcula sp. IMCC14364]